VFTPPDDLSDDALVSAINAGWNMTAASIEYRAVGFGSHHWDVVDARGDQRFATVDDLRATRHTLAEDEDTAFARLRAALVTAQDVRGAGCNFVVAPLPTAAAASLFRIDRRYAVALYPHIDGHSDLWSESPSPEQQRGVLDMITALHAVPRGATPHAPVDDYTIPHRDELELAVHGDTDLKAIGPYRARMSTLVAERAADIERLLHRYDGLVAEMRSRPRPAVVTHGEPHPGNIMRTVDGWKLIDWDTLLVAPPERDLWGLDAGDGSFLDAYQDATQITPDPSALGLYRLRWDLTDIAAYVSRFRGPHSESSDDEKSWDELRDLVAGLPT
jgi:hypothetical protein